MYHDTRTLPPSMGLVNLGIHKAIHLRSICHRDGIHDTFTK
jgi:hypothetical protein